MSCRLCNLSMVVGSRGCIQKEHVNRMKFSQDIESSRANIQVSGTTSNIGMRDHLLRRDPPLSRELSTSHWERLRCPEARGGIPSNDH